MGLAAGIVGLPNVGKSTLFNALTSGKAEAANYPFCTIDPNTGIVPVPDARHGRIMAKIVSKKIIPAFLELVDIAGLVKGASQGEGLGNQFLGHIKNVNAIVHVVRCFDCDDIVHVDGSVNPVRDIETINTELIFKDLETLEKAFDRMGKLLRQGDKSTQLKADIYAQVIEALKRGECVRNAVTDPVELAELDDLHLLTSKPVLYVANVHEDDVLADNAYVTALRDYAAKDGSGVVRICAQIEAEIARLDLTERSEFLESLGLPEPGLNVLARAIYTLLGLETFFTIGPEENRAWTIHKGTLAPQAAGVIHSDFEKGFIKADVYSIEDLELHGSEAGLRAAGRLRQEGREYLVKDGDVIFFKFNV